MRWLPLAALAVSITTTLSAQSSTEPINTDRPDFTESSTLVPLHRLQFESGYSWTEAKANAGGGGSATFPELLIRYGLSNRLEFRVGQSFTRVSPPAGQGSGITGRDDLYLGLKIGLGAQRGGQPALALLAHTSLPTGDSKTSASGTYPGLAILAGWDLSPDWSLDTGIEANRVSGDAWEIAPSLSLGRTISARVKGYAEIYSLLPVLAESGAGNSHYVNGGLAFLITDNFQLDARVGAGLSDRADRYFFGFGFAIRR
ncbi:MAG: transporter [Gemmatimonadales bacterium]